MKILVVDDSKVIRNVVRIFFMREGDHVDEAADGAEALERIRATTPDVVIADMKMPRLDGASLLIALKRSVKTMHVPVIILTGEADPASTARCLEAGAREVLRKPISPDALIAAVRRCVKAPSLEET